MKKGIAFLLAGLVLAVVVIVGYRNYMADLERKESAIRGADTWAIEQGREREAARRAAAIAEARRLADLQARQDAANADARRAELEVEQAAAEKIRRDSEAEIQRLEAERDELARAGEAADAEARQHKADRDRQLAEAQARRDAALAEVAKVTQEKREAADREARRIEALKRQQELEAQRQHRGAAVADDSSSKIYRSQGIGITDPNVSHGIGENREAEPK